MRHQHGYKKLQRESSHRKALLRNLATELIEHGSIRTTLAKARALRPVVEKIITRGKVDSVHHRRLVAQYLMTNEAVKHLFTVVGPKCVTRPGGYTRVTKFGPRFGDGALMAQIELVD